MTTKPYTHYDICVNVETCFVNGVSNEDFCNSIAEYLEGLGARPRNFNITLDGPSTVVQGALDTSDE